MKEIWADIPGYEGSYQASNLGRIKSPKKIDLRGHLRNEKILKPCINSDGYLTVSLYKNGKQEKPAIHSLIMLTFSPRKNVEHEINHKNEVKTDNCINNLEWITHKENCNYGTAQTRRIMTNKINRKRRLQNA
ncbi:MAG: NUMOD4 motif-containing HNH endonuclease [Lactococcus lactis]|nr:NUMOD4 motif-containing HNH endonuclease [Tetragenococcus halophilus]MDN6389017.1 NUMOD4 motif-containing HNH endonuclease [Lactococcus lactis]MDN6625958.1 NUMOD4 motif-containing HNH endonuclease [Pisciglobus halotolerans]MDN6748791.1 NUMOD4 motif-containing HNH endonuclease [Staphylococcus equorum]